MRRARRRFRSFGSRRSTVAIAHSLNDPETGLTFPSNGASSVRFHFQTPPTIQPLTLIWKINPIQQTGYYTTFFWGEEGGDVITSWPYFGCHPYPQGGGSGTVHNWEVAGGGGDDITDENANSTVVVKGQWYTQAAVSQIITGNELQVDFYWDLDVDDGRLISWDSTLAFSDYATANQPSNPGLMFGDAPWSEGNECMSAIFRGLQIYEGLLSLGQIQDRMNLTTDAAVVSADPGSLWYCNLNPTPDDISDKSGNGNNPVWANANRPTLWEP